jgi:hypothetical protein
MRRWRLFGAATLYSTPLNGRSAFEISKEDVEMKFPPASPVRPRRPRTQVGLRLQWPSLTRFRRQSHAAPHLRACQPGTRSQLRRDSEAGTHTCAQLGDLRGLAVSSYTHPDVFSSSTTLRISISTPFPLSAPLQGWRNRTRVSAHQLASQFSFSTRQLHRVFSASFVSWRYIKGSTTFTHGLDATDMRGQG